MASQTPSAHYLVALCLQLLCLVALSRKHLVARRRYSVCLLSHCTSVCLSACCRAVCLSAVCLTVIYLYHKLYDALWYARARLTNRCHCLSVCLSVCLSQPGTT